MKKYRQDTNKWSSEKCSSYPWQICKTSILEGNPWAPTGPITPLSISKETSLCSLFFFFFLNFKNGHSDFSVNWIHYVPSSKVSEKNLDLCLSFYYTVKINLVLTLSPKDLGDRDEKIWNLAVCCSTYLADRFCRLDLCCM